MTTRPFLCARHCLLPVLFLFATFSSAPAQRHDYSLVDLTVTVWLSSTRQAVGHVRVELLDGTGIPQTANYTNSDGEVQFLQLEPGTYRLRVADPDLEPVTTDLFRLERRQVVASQTVGVRLKPGARPEGAGAPGTVSAEDLKVPPKARKEWESGAKALERNELPEAQMRFQKAIDIYPQYARAYNSLGVVFMRSGQPERGRESFEKAIALNGSYAEALLNLAKIRMAEKDGAAAETLLQKAVAGDPANAEALTILANLQLMENKCDEAAASASKVHALEHQRFPMAHWIAGRAYEITHKDAEAVAEYTIFLKESPGGTLAERARASLKTLRAQNYPD
ncbi:MAG: tetratricopeptide repeat protein [Candidatus Koribacter versatilis]|uniref:Tetratricopeptide repeat protein n=1 Tax=Candidatus Korobacter versatilis TaxID=658062 RepID=A0A932A7S3_9BACT|nr:tetratricopeptide repeat protein [Candidatus Koribacter versatilis]